jgi:hypothetical protein
MTEKHVLVVLTNAVEGQDDAFNKWYDEQHLPDVLAIPGFVAAQRYTIAPDQMSDPALHTHRYLALYEIEGDANAALAGLGKAVEAGMYLDPSMAPDAVPVLYSAHGVRQVTKNT